MENINFSLLENNINDNERKLKTLLSSVGILTFVFLKNIIVPSTLTEIKCENLLKYATEH